MSPHQSAKNTELHGVLVCLFIMCALVSLPPSYPHSQHRNAVLCVKCKLKNRLYPLIGLIDDIICESLRHLAGSVLGSLQRVIQVALGGGGYHRGNKRSDSSCCLGAQKKRQKREISPMKLLIGGVMIRSAHSFMNNKYNKHKYFLRNIL